MAVKEKTVTLPFVEPLTIREPAPRVIPEPPRPGDPDGPPCRICTEHAPNEGIWSDDNWVLRGAAATSLPGSMWLATRQHFDSFADLPEALAAQYGPIAGRIERAILGLRDVGRVHIYRWGDGVAHFHIWFVPRPLGMLEASREMLMLWEDQLPPASMDQIADAGARVGAAMAASQAARDLPAD
jgi:diadenosine tetraphosphate (Ap4A) HIT family hydrolase